MFITVFCMLEKHDSAMALCGNFLFFIRFFLTCQIFRYINEDTTIVPLIKMIRDSGRSTFLVTNR